MEDSFKKAIDKITGKGKRFTVTSGLATEVGSDTCTVIREGLPDLLDVRFNAVEASLNSRFTITPAENSPVQVAMIEDTNEAFLISYSEIEKVEVIFPDTTLTIDNDGVVLDDGQNGGMVLAHELKTQLDKLSARVDGIIDAINNGIPAGGSSDGGTALQTSIKGFLAAIVDVEDFNNLENDKIKH